MFCTVTIKQIFCPSVKGIRPICTADTPSSHPMLPAAQVSPLFGSAFKGKDCAITACASKPLANIEHVSAWCVPDRAENPRCVQEIHMTAFIHFSLLRCKADMTSSFR